MRQSALTHTQNYIRSTKFIYILRDFKIEAYSSISTYSYEASPVIFYFFPLSFSLPAVSDVHTKSENHFTYKNLSIHSEEYISVKKMV